MAKKYIIELKINPNEIVEKYFSSQNSFTSSMKQTKIENISNKEMIFFVDETKRQCKCVISIPNKKNKCYWCHHFPTNNESGIGCPIGYVPNIMIKKYYSEISKNNYAIKDSITNQKLDEYKNTTDKRISIEEKDYYETDGFFCSFNCCMSFILENKHSPKYRNSKFLLHKIYSDYMNIPNGIEINPAPHWRKLIDYGGDLTIEKFRSAFNNITYKNHGTRIKNVSIGTIFEESFFI